MKVRAHETGLVQGLHQGIQACIANGLALPGVQNSVALDVFLNQLVDSIRRVKYVSTVASRSRNIHSNSANGASLMFDPLKAAIFQLRQGHVDEACWLVFLFVHFGKHQKAGWRYASEVYGALGVGQGWTWARVSAAPVLFRDWLRNNESNLKWGINRGFGNHRKYVSMSADKPNGTGAAIASYVHWVNGAGGHVSLFHQALSATGAVPEKAFDRLYRSMSVVKSFGRTAKFDYLTMLGKLGITTIRPGSAYIPGSTGPAKGGQLLFRVSGAPELSISQLDQKMIILGSRLNVGMQEIEDSICNWQKSPTKYIHFGG